MSNALSDTGTLSSVKRELLAQLVKKKRSGLGSKTARTIQRRKEGSGPAPASFAQQRLWFLDQLEPNSPHYNVPAAVRLHGPLNRLALSRSLSEVTRRHDSLRTSFSSSEGRLLQIVSPPEALPLPLIDLEAQLAAEGPDSLHELLSREARRPFNLETGPLLRASLFALSADEHVLLLVMHHIVSDGWSMAVLIEEVAALYRAYLRGEESPLPELEVQYTDYAAWQREWLAGEEMERQLTYWREQLEGEIEVLELPTDRVRPSVQSFNGAVQRFRVSAEVTAGLKALGQEERATLYMVLLSGFGVLLRRWSGQEQVMVGSPVANRRQAEVEKLIGFFVNTLVMKVRMGGEESFRELVRRVREETLSAYGHQDVPFERLVEELQVERNLSFSPLFQTWFVLQNTPSRALELEGLTLELLELESRTSKFDLALFMEETPDGLTCAFEYNTDLFNAETIERMVGHFKTLLGGIVSTPDVAISKLPLLTEAERRQLIKGRNLPATAEVLTEACLHTLFEAQAERTPGAIALTFEGERLSYRELNQRANRLAYYLRSKGVGPEDRVGIYFERSAEMLVAVLGVLKAGAAYVPLDPQYPQERLAFMLEDARVSLLLTQQRLLERVADVQAQALCLDTEWDVIADFDAGNPPSGASAGNLAYIIYTSGSTGRPKGVGVSHANAARLFEATRSWFNFNERDVFTLFHSLAFDFSVWEIWGALLHGGRLVVVPYWISRSPEAFYHLLCEEGVTVLNQTPSSFRQVSQVEESLDAIEELALRLVIFGGEALELQSLKAWFDRHGDEYPQLVNMYGITETTVHVTYRPITIADLHKTTASVIGGPIPDLRVYVLDAHQQPVPVGVTGELYVGGAGLARGYLNQPALTGTRFIPDPFGDVPGERLYKSGDLARYTSTFDLEYLGRSDGQVKIRGFRIELGEIEAVLAAHPSVMEVVALVREDNPHDRRLVAYMVSRPGLSASIAELRSYLKQHLPEHMIPAAFVLLEKMPLTTNGKIDRRALPAPDVNVLEPEEGFIAPRTPLEALVAGIWREVLGVERVGVHSNFFELGGHSLLATQLISRLRTALQVEVSLRSLFESPTVSEIAENIAGALRDKQETPPCLLAIERVWSAPEGESALVESRLKDEAQALAVPSIRRRSRESGPAPASFAQQRLWFLDQLEPNSPHYNVPAAVRLRGHLDITALSRSLSEVMRRHESLRTTFSNQPEGLFQLISEPAPLPLPLTDLEAAIAAQGEKALRHALSTEASRPFNLETGPLLRASLLRLSEQEHVLLLVLHHIVSDGWSMAVLIEEVSTLYAAYVRGEESPLEELQVQYSDYAQWQREWLAGEELERQLTYWREELREATEVLELPTDRVRPAVQTFNGAVRRFQVGRRVMEGLKEVGQQEGATLYMVLLSAFAVLMRRWSGQEQVMVGSPVANRRQAEVEKLIGFFVNTLVMRGDMRGDPSFREMVSRVREQTLSAYGHQDVPFERLVEELQVERNLSFSPLFQVMFTLLNVPARDLDLPGLSVSPVEVDLRSAKFDLLMRTSETEEGLEGVLEYNTDLFDAETIERMSNHFTTLLESIFADPSLPISGLQWLTAGERKQLLVEWNQTQRAPAQDGLIHRLFEQQAERTPEQTALVSGDRRLTYCELNRRANRLARHLRQIGVGPEVRVGIMMERTVEMVVGLLAILKAGGAYVPLDPQYPQERLAFMLEDAEIRVLLTQRSLLATLPPHRARLVVADTAIDDDGLESEENLSEAIAARNLAYVIYTSGSTGRPKGVMITHHSASVLLNWARELFTPEQLRGVLASTSICFDLSVFELFAPLSCGGQVILVENVLHLPELAAAGEVTLVNTVPSAMTELVRAGGLPASVRVVNLAGEPLPLALAQLTYQNTNVEQVWNLYGPSEDTTYSTCALVERGAGTAPTIGRPVDDTEAYVLDSKLQPVAIGIPGELYIGGEGLARGYLNRPRLTAEKFIPNPFGTSAGARLYKTGDLVRYLPDGNLEFLGRLDHQVKVRGFRIELGEVETVIGSHQAVRECIVVARAEESGEKRLVAYVVAQAGREPSTSELRQHVAQRLPAHMVPGAFVMLDALPLTPNGKVDRKALPSPNRAGATSERGYVAPRTPTEEVVAGIWEQVLGVERVGVHDNFFEHGGHSLLATQVIARIREAFGKDVPLRALFETPTVGEIAEAVERLDQKETGKLSPLRPASREERAPVLSLTQLRHWNRYLLDPQSSAYNIYFTVRLKGHLDVSALGRSLNEIVRRHEVLRTNFGLLDGEPVQLIRPSLEPLLSVEDFRMLHDEEREAALRQRILQEARHPFNLTTEPLLRLLLLRLGEDEHVFVLNVHHIVWDGWSTSVFMSEMAALYKAYTSGTPSPLPEPPIQYADFALWQREWMKGEAREAQLAFWKEQFAGGFPVLELQTDRPRAPAQQARGGLHHVELSPALTCALKRLGQAEGGTPFMVLLSAFELLLGECSGQDDFVLGTTLANRHRVEVEGLIGCFNNAVLVRADLSGNPTYRDLLGRVRRTTLGAFRHSDLAVSELIQELSTGGAHTAGQLFRAFFVLQSAPVPDIALNGLEMELLDVHNQTAKRDIGLSLSESGGALSGAIEYNADLFEPPTISRMAERFRELLEEMVAHPERRIAARPPRE